MWPWQRLMTSRRPAAAPAEIDTSLLDCSSRTLPSRVTFIRSGGPLHSPCHRARHGREPPTGAPIVGAADGRLMFGTIVVSSTPIAVVVERAVAGLAVDHRLDFASVDADVVQAAIVEGAQHHHRGAARPHRPVGVPPALEHTADSLLVMPGRGRRRG